MKCEACEAGKGPREESEATFHLIMIKGKVADDVWVCADCAPHIRVDVEEKCFTYEL